MKIIIHRVFYFYHLKYHKEQIPTILKNFYYL